MRKGALDMSLVPISYSGGDFPELNIGLMPALVVSYEQGASWKNQEVGKFFSKFLEEKGVKIISWIWQAGGVASKTKPLVSPEDAKDMKVRGGSREMDMILKTAGAAVLTIPSNEIYVSLQTGAMDAAMTSSTSLMSFKLHEVTKHLTTGRGKAYWFMLEPLMMSKDVFDKLPKEHQDAIMAAGAEMEAFGTEEAKKDDQLVADVYIKAGATVSDLDDPLIEKWQKIAREVAWKDYASKNENCAKLLELAQKTLPAQQQK